MPVFSFERVVMSLEAKEALEKKYGSKTVEKMIHKLNQYLISHPNKKYASHPLKIAEWIELDKVKTQNLSKDMSWYPKAKERANLCPYIEFFKDGVGIHGKRKILKSEEFFKEKVLNEMLILGIDIQNL